MGWPPALSIMAGPGRRRRVRPPATEDCLPGARPEDVPGTAFSASLAANTLGFFIAFGTELFIAQYLQLVLGLSPLQAGLWSLPSAVGFIVGAMLTPVIVRRVRPAFAMAAGLGLAAVGYAIISQVDATAALTGPVTRRRVLPGPD